MLTPMIITMEGSLRALYAVNDWIEQRWECRGFPHFTKGGYLMFALEVSIDGGYRICVVNSSAKL